MARNYRLTVGTSEAGRRLDQYLVARLPSELSRALIQRLIRDGQVQVSGRVSKAHQRLRRGDMVVAHVAVLPDPASTTPLIPQPIPLDIVYEDAQLLVVNKPPGLVSHPAPGHWDGTLVNAILWHLHSSHDPENAESGKGNGESQLTTPHSALRTPHLARAGLVHRLDKDTSGLLLIAKTAIAHTALAKQLAARRMSRRYYALVEGHVRLDTGTLSASIGRHATHRKDMAVRHLGGRSAVTHYRVVRRFGRAGRRAQSAQSKVHSPWSMETPARPSEFPYTLLEVALGTGRTHQIRVHMAHLGHPVLGDTTYGRRPAGFWHSLGIARQMLHAYHLTFQHPASGIQQHVAAPLPADMVRWCPRVTLRVTAWEPKAGPGSR